MLILFSKGCKNISTVLPIYLYIVLVFNTIFISFICENLTVNYLAFIYNWDTLLLILIYES